MLKAIAVRDRIKELRRVRASELAPSPNNWRTHPKAQSDALSGLLSEIGYADALLARETPDGLMLIDGHLRAALTPEAMVPVLVLDVDEHEANLLLATLDPLAAMAASDAAKLDALLREVNSGDAAVQAMLSELAKQTPFGLTSTERDGQGVSSTWGQVEKTDNQKVVIGEIETRLPADIVQMLADALNRAYEEDRTPIYETLAAIIVAGVRAVEAGSD